MPQYTCPKCKAVLKRDQPLGAGKKLKCPKCAAIFGPPAKSAAQPGADEDDDRNPYAVKKDEAADEKMRDELERAAQGLIKDRFKKSKRGPASREVVRPSH